MDVAIAGLALNRRTPAPPIPLTADHLSGRSLYGDDFTEAQIARWFADEMRGYFDICEDRPYPYHLLNAVYGFADLKPHYRRCLALGCAKGDDIAPIASRIDEIVAIEPARGWWRNEIGGTPARYVMPKPSGAIDLPAASVDLVTCFGVLHHIPNVSAVLSELARVCAPGATLIFREPTHTMGDFRQPRAGLTRNERGIDPAWLIRKAAHLGLRARRVTHYDLGAFSRMMAALGLQRDEWRALMWIDRALCAVLRWNRRYWRTRAWHKLAPSSALYVFEKV